MCNVSVYAYGRSSGRRAVANAHFAGEVETATTAVLAAVQIALFLRGVPVPGVWHSNMILDAEEILQAIADRRIGQTQIDPLHVEP